jgi:hypothetical protein
VAGAVHMICRVLSRRWSYEARSTPQLVTIDWYFSPFDFAKPTGSRPK